MQTLARVFFHVDPCDADLLDAMLRFYSDVSACANGCFVLCDLIALGQISVEVVLSCKFIQATDLRSAGKTKQYGIFNDLLIHSGEGAWVSEAHRTDLRIGPFTIDGWIR